MSKLTNLEFGDGAQFTFSAADMATINRVALEEHGVPVAELTIGKAGLLLMGGYLSTIYNGAFEVEGVAIDSDLDGTEATKNSVEKHLTQEIDEKMRDAVIKHGKLLVRVFADGTDDLQDAKPMQEFQVLSSVRKEFESAFVESSEENIED